MAEKHKIVADEVARKAFATSFRGFDQYQVRAFLGEVAAELAATQERERSLRTALAVAEERAKPVEAAEADLDLVLGQETGKVLQAAHHAAAEIRSRAEEQVGRMVREANDEAARLRKEAETVLGVRTAEADAAAREITEEAAARAAEELETAQARGREMVAEAQEVRERVLRDMARRRKLAHQQLERLLAGRERLLAAYEVVRGNLDDATGELTVAEAEARLAAQAVAEPDDGDEEPMAALEAEVAAARAAGLTVEVRPAGDSDHPVGADAGLDTNGVPAAEPPAVDEATEPPAPPAEVGAARDEPPDEPRVGPAEERRTSALRILRRRAEVVPVPGRVVAETSAHHPVAPADEHEGVRIIPADPEAPAGQAHTGGLTLVPEEEPAPASPAGVDQEAEPAKAPASGSAEGPAEAVRPPDEEAPAPVEPADAGPEVTPEPAKAEPGVDDLFSRLRASRAAAVAEAQVFLGADDSGTTPTAPADEAVVADRADDEALIDGRDAAVEPAERALGRALKRSLADEQNEVLDTLRRHRGAPVLADLLPDADDHAARHAKVATAPLVEAAEAGRAGAGGPVAVDDLAGALANEVVTALRGRVDRALADAGGDDDALVQAISAGYREWKSSRLEALVGHHVLAAHERGRYDALDGPARWVVDRTGGCGPDCDDNALAGPTPKGSAFPTGHRHPPAHPGCRCLVAPPIP
ncbi:MAG TPA: DivIVA domain-containing protein [Acidimicrobiales bacterium]|nr:DivIVA domain-containing protein [Acidimicrobiales bacterium]